MIRPLLDIDHARDMHYDHDVAGELDGSCDESVSIVIQYNRLAISAFLCPGLYKDKSHVGYWGERLYGSDVVVTKDPSDLDGEMMGIKMETRQDREDRCTSLSSAIARAFKASNGVTM